MKFLADESVERAVVALFRDGGHDVVYIAEVSPGAEDDAVLDLADGDDRILVTNDKDFGELVFLKGQSAAGIVLVRVGAERTASKLAAVERLLRTDLSRLEGHFTVLGEHRIRRRPLRKGGPA
ncbi:MAG: DUF5615 family PIN-like protein [Deltaproteobacteria bacterium]|nr:DUF5615 family PIN-like protein [Deltaproteobacteria bacterium]